MSYSVDLYERVIGYVRGGGGPADRAPRGGVGAEGK